MRPVPFIKMHGCGNDYVFLDCFTQLLPPNPSELARRVSDRHTSVGSDGLVLMEPAETAGVQGQMRMFNRDGSEGTLCINAVRCFAMWLYHSGRTGPDSAILMHQRILETRVTDSDPGRGTATVSVNLGQIPPIRDTAADPAGAIVRRIRLADVRLSNVPVELISVSLGNPHAVMFLPNLSLPEIAVLGPTIESHPAFPDRTNVEFAQVTGANEVRVRVWERGSGETRACGSGACAVTLAGVFSGDFRRDQPVQVLMPGGMLRTRLDDQQNLHVQGPAAESFRGELPESSEVRTGSGPV